MSTMLLVKGDTRTQIKSTITRAYDGSVVDLNTASSVFLRFRKRKLRLFTLVTALKKQYLKFLAL